MTESAGADDLLLTRAYLSRVAEPASIAVWRWVQRMGPIDAARTIHQADVPDEVAAATAARRAQVDAEADLEAAQRHGIRLVGPESPQWPHFAFACLEHAVTRRRNDRPQADQVPPVPPIALWVKGNGDLASCGVRTVAIVGARAATPYGEHVTAELSYGLASRGVAVISGGAYGIDAAAHRAALAAEGQTVIVSAGGLDRPYPAGNAQLFERVGATGLVISESPPGAAPQRHRFLSRNRLIAALGAGTVIVEAASRSGALNTAAHCFAIGRPVMAVPGPVTSAMSTGCHALLRRETNAALLVTRVEDVLAVVGSVGEGLTSEARLPSHSGFVGDGSAELACDVRKAFDALDPVARRVFDGMPARRPVTEDQLAVLSGVSTIEVLRALPALQLVGLVEAGEDGYRVAARLRRRTKGGK